MADKNLRLRTTPVFPRTRPSTDDATARSAYDLENRWFSAGATDPLAELERLVREIDSFVDTRAGVGGGPKVNNFDASRGYIEEPSPAAPADRDDPATRINAPPQRYQSPNNDACSSQSYAVEEDVDPQVYDEADFADDQQHESEYYDDERGYAAETDGSQGDAYTHYADPAPGPGRTRRKTLMTVGAVLGLLLIGAVGAYTYRFIFGSAPGVPPVVNADTSPTKIAVAPSDNAGSSLVPREEQPVDLKLSAPSVQQQSPPAASVAPEPSPVQSPTEPHPVQTVAVSPSTAPDESAAAAAAPAPAGVTAAPQPASPRPAASKADQKIASQGEVPETSQVGQSPVARYMVQISASATREEATAALKAAQAKYPDVLGGRQSQVREKKTADKAPLFAAQFGPFASRAEAADLCQRLKSAGGSCYVP
jgi:hypothetical protein